MHTTPAPLPPGPQWLGVRKHPSTGIRLPELFLPGLLAALKRRGVPGELTLSFGRETAPEAVINAAPGTWEITRGHTGTSIREYMTLAAQLSTAAGVPVEIEGDHLILIGSQAASLRRLAGQHAHEHISPEQLRQSLDYYRQCLDEAVATGVVACFTIDASDLYWHRADRLRAFEVERLFAERFGSGGEALLARYGRTWRLPAYRGPVQPRGLVSDCRARACTAPTVSSDRASRRGTPPRPTEETTTHRGFVTVTITRAQARRLALKFHDSLQASAELYRYCREKLGDRPFSWEIALDETAAVTTPREALFYLLEWQALGFTCEYLGPNVGFAKRVDYTGSRAALQRLVRQHDAIVRAVSGGLLSIHSGDGAHPYSGKGEGTYEAILAGCGGVCKFKISDIYYELLMEHLAALPAGSEGRRLFEAIFDAVESYLREQIATGGPLVTPLLLRQFEAYDAAVRRDPAHRRHPRADCFRCNEFLSLNMRDESGGRPFRTALLRFVREHDDFRTQFDAAVEALTLRMIDGLKLGNNED